MHPKIVTVVGPFQISVHPLAEWRESGTVSAVHLAALHTGLLRSIPEMLPLKIACNLFVCM